VDGEQWPRACLRAELIERGYDAYGFITVEDALRSLTRGSSPKPELIIVESRDQDLTRQVLEAIRELHTATVLLGGMIELNDPVIRNGDWDVVLKRPFSLGKVADVVQSVLARRAA
jgi:hypothetical protein